MKYRKGWNLKIMSPAKINLGKSPGGPRVKWDQQGQKRAGEWQ